MCCCAGSPVRPTPVRVVWKVGAVEIRYLRSAYGVSRTDGMSNESVYERYGMRHVGEVKRQTLKWFGHMERMEEGKVTRRVYVSEIRGREC